MAFLKASSRLVPRIGSAILGGLPIEVLLSPVYRRLGWRGRRIACLNLCGLTLLHQATQVVPDRLACLKVGLGSREHGLEDLFRGVPARSLGNGLTFEHPSGSGWSPARAFTCGVFGSLAEHSSGVRGQDFLDDSRFLGGPGTQRIRVLIQINELACATRNRHVSSPEPAEDESWRTDWPCPSASCARPSVLGAGASAACGPVTTCSRSVRSYGASLVPDLSVRMLARRSLLGSGLLSTLEGSKNGRH